VNQLIYDFARRLDATNWSTMLHESYYMYNWVETTHVLALMISLGFLFLIDLRMLGYAMSNIPATRVADRLHWPMIFGFTVMVITGLLLFYAIPVRTSQSVWFRIKLVLMFGALINALVFHWRMQASQGDWENELRAPEKLRRGARRSILFWTGIVICGRLIAYDWFDCIKNPNPLLANIAGCIADQEVF
jgi:hypothetical protein